MKIINYVPKLHINDPADKSGQGIELLPNNIINMNLIIFYYFYMYFPK